MAKRFRFSDTSSSSLTDIQVICYPSSPHKFSIDLDQNHPSSSSSSTLQPLFLPLQAAALSSSVTPHPSSSTSSSPSALGFIAPHLPVPHLGVQLLLAHPHRFPKRHLVPSLPPKLPYPAVPTEIRHFIPLFSILTAWDYNAFLRNPYHGEPKYWKRDPQWQVPGGD